MTGWRLKRRQRTQAAASMRWWATPTRRPPTTPWPIYGLVNCYCDRGKVRYDGLEVKAETKNTSRGLYALVGYTYSQAFDNGLADLWAGKLLLRPRQGAL